MINPEGMTAEDMTEVMVCSAVVGVVMTPMVGLEGRPMSDEVDVNVFRPTLSSEWPAEEREVAVGIKPTVDPPELGLAITPPPRSLTATPLLATTAVHGILVDLFFVFAKSAGVNKRVVVVDGIVCVDARFCWYGKPCYERRRQSFALRCKLGCDC